MAAEWTSYIPTIVTGLVGLGGIGGAAWQAKQSREAATADLRRSLDAATENLRLGIAAGNERARVAERRHIYAEYLAAVNAQLLAFHRLFDARRKEEGKQAIDSMWREIESHTTEGNNARMALDLIASEGVIEQAVRITDSLNEIEQAVRESQTEEAWTGLADLDLLGNAMRADLGEASVNFQREGE
jgi:hypothetical protein